MHLATEAIYMVRPWHLFILSQCECAVKNLLENLDPDVRILVQNPDARWQCGVNPVTL
jgi:hypothetical protein